MIRCRPRGLFRSPSMPNPGARLPGARLPGARLPGARLPVKRPECPRDENTPVRVKRRRSLAATPDAESPRMVRRTLNIHPFMHTFTHRRRRGQPHRATDCCYYYYY